MARIPVTDAEQSTADANGVVTVQFVVPTRQTWELHRCTVHCTDDDPMPRASIYRGQANVVNLITSTPNGANHTADGTTESLGAGSVLTVQWTNAKPGATCTAVISGWADVQQ